MVKEQSPQPMGLLEDLSCFKAIFTKSNKVKNADSFWPIIYQINIMKTLKNFKNQVITQPQAIKGGGIIRRGKIKKKQTLGPSFAIEANGKGTKSTTNGASARPQLF